MGRPGAPSSSARTSTSVQEGPGINDNGSGTAVILEVAIRLAKFTPYIRNKVQFMFFGAEEANLLGSEDYLASLSETELNRILLNLNFDMLGSPNFVRFVYDGDGSDTPDAGPPGSDVIEKVFRRRCRRSTAVQVRPRSDRCAPESRY